MADDTAGPWTPGPWREVLETRAIEICTIHCCSPRSTTEPEAQRWLYIVSDNSVCRSEQEQDANARLIAAAPSLYGALEYIFEHIADKERGPRDLYPAFGLNASRAVEMARAALALARGETR